MTRPWPALWAATKPSGSSGARQPPHTASAPVAAGPSAFAGPDRPVRRRFGDPGPERTGARPCGPDAACTARGLRNRWDRRRGRLGPAGDRGGVRGLRLFQPRRDTQPTPGQAGGAGNRLALYGSHGGRDPGQRVARNRLFHAGIPVRTQRGPRRADRGRADGRSRRLAAAGVHHTARDPGQHCHQPDAGHAADTRRLHPDLGHDRRGPCQRQHHAARYGLPGSLQIRGHRLRHCRRYGPDPHRRSVRGSLPPPPQGAETVTARNVLARSTWVDVALLLTGACFLLPLLWLVLGSVDPSAGHAVKVPQQPGLDNFAAVLTPELLFRPLWNSLLLSAGTGMVTLAAAVLAAYPLSRYRSRFTTPFMYGILFGTCLPITAIMVPVS